MRALLAALSFLTVFPVRARVGEEDLEKSVPFFPLVGLILGAVAAAAAALLYKVLPPMPAAAILVAFLAFLSRGLHLDGLADTADGLLSGRDKEGMLSVMRDSRIGAMGAAALFLVLALKITLFASLAPGDAVAAAFLAPIAGRCAIVLNLTESRYARSGGLAAVFFRRKCRWEWMFLLFGICAALSAGRPGVYAALSAGVFAYAWTSWTNRRLGGATGDTIGAGCELAELAPPLVLAMHSFAG